MIFLEVDDVVRIILVCNDSVREDARGVDCIDLSHLIWKMRRSRKPHKSSLQTRIMGVMVGPGASGWIPADLLLKN